MFFHSNLCYPSASIRSLEVSLSGNRSPPCHPVIIYCARHLNPEGAKKASIKIKNNLQFQGQLRDAIHVSNAVYMQSLHTWLMYEICAKSCKFISIYLCLKFIAIIMEVLKNLLFLITWIYKCDIPAW